MGTGADIEKSGTDSPVAELFKFVGTDVACNDGAFVFHHGTQLQCFPSGSGAGVEDPFPGACGADSAYCLTGKILNFKASLAVALKGKKVDPGGVKSCRTGNFFRKFTAQGFFLEFFQTEFLFFVDPDPQRRASGKHL